MATRICQRNLSTPHGRRKTANMALIAATRNQRPCQQRRAATAEIHALPFNLQDGPWGRDVVALLEPIIE
eukprot:4836210-Lingulodinium_polyedra.AAC.1